MSKQLVNGLGGPDFPGAVKHNSTLNTVPPEKLLADLLKRRMRRAMGDVTECPAHALPAHLARLDGLREIGEHCIRHWLRETPESLLSGAQLAYPVTVADFLAAMAITRREHRAPVFVNQRDAEISEIHRKLDLIGGLLSQQMNLPTPDAFCNSDGENER